jgi:protease I
MVAKKVLLLVGDFNEDLEVYFALQTLTLVGHSVAAVAPNKKKGEKIATAVHDFEEFHTYTEKRGRNFTLTHDFDSINENEFDALYIPGM